MHPARRMAISATGTVTCLIIAPCASNATPSAFVEDLNQQHSAESKEYNTLMLAAATAHNHSWAHKGDCNSCNWAVIFTW